MFCKSVARYIIKKLFGEEIANNLEWKNVYKEKLKEYGNLITEAEREILKKKYEKVYYTEIPELEVKVVCNNGVLEMYKKGKKIFVFYLYDYDIEIADNMMKWIIYKLEEYFGSRGWGIIIGSGGVL